MTCAPSAEGFWVDPASERRLFYRLWQPSMVRAALIIVHGFGEHGGRYDALASALAESDILVAGPDLVGHGRSEGPRGAIGDVASCAATLQAFTEDIVLSVAGRQEYAIFGHSFGGLLAIHWLLHATPALSRAVIQAPLLEAGFPIPGWKRVAASVLSVVRPSYSLSMNLDVGALSHDPTVGAAYQADPLVHNHMSAGTYQELLKARDPALTLAPTIRTPVLFLYGTADRIVSVKAAQRWYDRLTTQKRHVAFLDAYHELHHEPKHSRQVLELVRDWVLQVGLLCLLWLSPPLAAQAEEPPEPTDWPATISRLRQEMQDHPGLASIRQQLAIAYNNHAVSLGEVGKWREAIEQLDEAIRLDPTNPQFSENLGAMHLHQAQLAFEQNRFQDAKTAVERAIRFNPQSATAHRLLGEVEYATQRLQEAQAAWQRAHEFEPHQAGLKERLQQLAQELPVESKFERLTHAYFDLRYENGVERPIGFDIRNVLLQARREVGSHLAYWPSYKILVLLYNAESFRAMRQETPDWVAGQFDGKIRVPLPDQQLDDAMVRQIIFHEYTHALVHDLASGKCPTWLNEGLAEYEGATQRPPTLSHLANAHAEGHLLPWTTLSEQFSTALSADEVALGYQQAHSIAAYLIHRYGLWRIRRVLKALAQEPSWETVLSQEYHRKLERLEADWQEWLPEFLRPE